MLKFNLRKEIVHIRELIDEIQRMDLGSLRNWKSTNEWNRIDFSLSDRQVFHIFLVKPTRYDEDGYPIHWVLSTVPANSLACLNGIALEAAERNVLGDDVEIRVTCFDETCDIVDYPALIRKVRANGQQMMLGLVGVQSNQYPRAMDVAEHFVSAGEPVCIGGFHVSGCLSMLKDMPPELLEAQARGISLFSGEAESGRFDRVLKDAWDRKLQPLYDYLDEMVPLEDQPLPLLPDYLVKRNLLSMSSIDLGRGCPYKCTYCCIINVQGKKSRSRSVDSFERFIRHAADTGIRMIFITDDNFSRNKDWEIYLDRLIALRKEGVKIGFLIQVDTLCHKVPGFIDKCVAAGVNEVFVGLENINPDNLKAMKKYQNKITEYREMLLAWKRHPVIVYGAYIIGMPNDTEESILRDVEIIKRELPIDLLNATILTPLPGSADHRDMVEQGEWMDPDLNQYDLMHRVVHHPNMSDETLDRVYQQVWNNYYNLEHVTTLFKRIVALGGEAKIVDAVLRLMAFGINMKVNNIKSFDMGLMRRKPRLGRRPGMPVESPLVFYPKHYLELAKVGVLLTIKTLGLTRMVRRVAEDPSTKEYLDLAITPPNREELDALDMYQQTRGGTMAVELVRHREKTRKFKDVPTATEAG